MSQSTPTRLAACCQVPEGALHREGCPVLTEYRRGCPHRSVKGLPGGKRRCEVCGKEAP